MEADKYPGIYIEGESPIQLVEQLKERGKWYCKTMAARLITGFRGNIEFKKRIILIENLNRDFLKDVKYFQNIYSLLEEKEIKNHQDSDVLIPLRKVTLEFLGELEKILNKKGDFNLTKKLKDQFLELGSEYRLRLMKDVWGIRKYPGYENFDFKTTDIHGILFNSTFTPLL